MVKSGSIASFNIPEYIEETEQLKNIPSSGITLGQRLFEDKNLSSNKQVSCASCHEQKFAFADGIALNTVGVSGEKLSRNSPALFNLAWHNAYFWDGGANDLESQALGPILSEHELNTNMNEIISYLTSSNEYKSLFSETFSDKKINTYNVLTTLKWYQLSLLSFNSKYDSFFSTQDSGLFSLSEKEGLHVYETNCNSCHQLPLASSYDYKNNLLDSVFNFEFEDPRWGRYRITNEQEDIGKYKIPSLRNLSYTAPYMHDGRLSTLDEVINHYNGKTLNNKEISLTAQNTTDLKNFLLTLNDSRFVN